VRAVKLAGAQDSEASTAQLVGGVP
jgi:hypothetical protein